MKQLPKYGLLGAVIGMAIGLMGGIRWIACLAVDEAPVNISFTYMYSHPIVYGIIMIALILMVFSSTRAVVKITTRHILLAAISIVLGVGCYGSTIGLANAIDMGWPGCATFLVALLIMIAMIAWIVHLRRISVILALFALGFLPCSREVSLLTGDSLARMAFVYSPLPSFNHYFSLMASIILLSSFIGLVSSLLTRCSEFHGAIIGATIGAIIGFCVNLAQITVFIAAMRSGQDMISILSAMVAVWTYLGFMIAISVYAWSTPHSVRLLKLTPVATVLVIGAYILSGLYGYSDYRLLTYLHSDGLYIYIHVSADGSWRRTLDESACRTRTERVQEFLYRYPFSAYRPAAMLTMARSLFEEWRFDDALETLSAFSCDYPQLRDRSDVLQTLSGLAAGKPAIVLRHTTANSYYSKWMQTQGAQIAADASERVGMPVRAYGYHSSYIDYLADGRPTSWTKESERYSRNCMESFARLFDKDEKRIRFGRIRVRIICPSGPVHGVRVVLVKPHVDGTLPSDSFQFTGAWSIPAWGGIWSVTNKNGIATISDVPYGTYEVVLGFGLNTLPIDAVLSRVPTSIVVGSRDVFPETIKMTPSVRLLSPLANASVTSPAQLKWEAYPGADHYSASLIAIDETRESELGGIGIQRGETCWARANIHDVSTVIDPKHFVNGEVGLLKGRSYMWVIYAYASDGRFLSSSEHYLELRERTFRVRPSNTNKGGSLQ